MAGEDWYSSNQTQSDKNQPWYHVLVSGSDQVTYPAQSSLIPDESCQKIDNPLTVHFFEAFDHGKYIRNTQPWPR
jgi:hemimethylated DNA binding protein